MDALVLGVFLITFAGPLHLPVTTVLEGAERMSQPQEVASVYTVHLERKADFAPEAIEATHVELLSSVLGSEAAAKDALLYSYKTAMNGFSAKLTPSQVTALSGKPGVLQVLPGQTLQLHDETGAAKPGQI